MSATAKLRGRSLVELENLFLSGGHLLDCASFSGVVWNWSQSPGVVFIAPGIFLITKTILQEKGSISEDNTEFVNRIMLVSLNAVKEVVGIKSHSPVFDYKTLAGNYLLAELVDLLLEDSKKIFIDVKIEAAGLLAALVKRPRNFSLLRMYPEKQ
ncbi:hypothetical protein HDU82_001116 [Entophlyctis luteolus]|nr:hypothetical protein HDU82_001116 [Entophlyctis luteolus]